MPNTGANASGSMSSKLKVGLLLDSEISSQYVYDLAKWAQTQENMSLSHLIVQKADATGKGEAGDAAVSSSQGLLSRIRAASFALIVKVENLRIKKIKRFKHYENHLEPFNLKQIVPESVKITPIAATGESGFHYSAEDIQKIKELDLDVLVHCGSGKLCGEILNSSRFGVISFCYSDIRTIRGAPPGFWEAFYKQDHTGFTILHRTGDSNGGKILKRGRFRTKSFFLLNQADLYTKSGVYLKEVLSYIAANRTLPPAEESLPYFNPLYGPPNLAEQFRYVMQVVSSLFRNAINASLLKRDYRWAVAFQHSDWKNLDMGQANKIRNRPHHYLADPFAISEGGREYCFAEDYDYKTGRGCICVYELKGNTAERLGDAIVEPFHMSFPYLFRFDSKLYMCPETSEKEEIRLYESVKFPLEWKLSKTLMSNVSAVDSMIFERDGLWWLLTNIDPTKTGSHYSELFAFYSDHPIEGEWHPHPKNPLLIDSSKGRNGGILFDDRWIYRVSQKQGFDTYGKAFAINKIKVLNREEYSETEVCSVDPNFFPKLQGCHHMNSNGTITCFDFGRISRVDD
jgi:hypothetical protein